MSRLTLGSCSEMTENTLKELNKVGINTVLDFIGEDIQSLSEKTCLPLQELSVIRRDLLVKHSAVAYSGEQLFEKMIDSLKIISTGCANLDQLLGGGLYSKEVTEIYGSPAAGKTQSCLSIACHIATEHEKNVIYIDTGATFSTERIKEIVGGKFTGSGNETENLMYLSRVQCIKAFDIFAVLSTLEGLMSRLSVEEDPFYQDVVLIVVDCVTSLISPILGGMQHHGHSLMVNLGRMLKCLAVNYNLAVLVTNNVVSDFVLNSYTKPALGKTWSHLPNNRIHMYNSAHNPSQRLLKMTKSCRMPLQIVMTASVTEDGLKS